MTLLALYCRRPVTKAMQDQSDQYPDDTCAPHLMLAKAGRWLMSLPMYRRHPVTQGMQYILEAIHPRRITLFSCLQKMVCMFM